MQISETTFKKLPEQLKHLFKKLPNPGSEDVLAAFPTTTSGKGAVKRASSADGHGNAGAAYGAESRPAGTPMVSYGDTGSAARFFYCAKASRSDRNEGLPGGGAPAVGTGATMREREDADWSARNGNYHPTVKPTDLMAYLCRLVTPPGGVVLDPFMGSGSTGKAAIREGFRFVGCELSEEYLAIARARIEHEASKVAAAAAAPKPQEQSDLFAA